MIITKTSTGYQAVERGLTSTEEKERNWAIDATVAKAFGACPDCMGAGYHEIMGDGANFEVDVINSKPCRLCDGTGEDEHSN